MKKLKSLILLTSIAFMLITGCKHEAKNVALSEESDHMVLTNTDSGIKIQLQNLPAGVVKVNNNSRITVDNSDIFISIDKSDENSVLIYPFVENEKSYVFTLSYNYKNFAGKEIRISEKAKIKADVKNPKQNPLNINLAKQLSFKASWSTEDRCFYYNVNTALENMEGLISDEVYSCIVEASVYGDDGCELLSKFKTNDYTDGKFTYTNKDENVDLLANGQNITASSENLPVLLKTINKNNNYTYTTKYLFELKDIGLMYYSYEPKTLGKGTINPMYKDKSFVGSWKENTDSKNKEIFIIDEYGFILINNGQSYGVVYYESDSDITCKLKNGSVLKLQYSDSKLTNTETSVEYIKASGNENIESTIETKLPEDVNITVEILGPRLYINIDSDDYWICNYEIDGATKYYFNWALNPYIDDIEPGVHLLTVFYRSTDDTAIYSKTISFEIE